MIMSHHFKCFIVMLSILSCTLVGINIIVLEILSTSVKDNKNSARAKNNIVLKGSATHCEL